MVGTSFHQNVQTVHKYAISEKASRFCKLPSLGGGGVGGGSGAGEQLGR